MGGIVDFRDFAAHRGGAVAAKHFGKLLQRLEQSERRLVENHRSLLVGKGGKACGATLLLREEALEAETVAGKTGIDNRRDKSGGTGETFHLDILAATLAHKKETGVGNRRRSGIRHQSDGLARFEAFNHLSHSLMLVEFVVSNHVGVDLEMLHEHATGAGVFGED